MTEPSIPDRLRMRASARLSVSRPSKIERADAELDLAAAEEIERLGVANALLIEEINNA